MVTRFSNEFPQLSVGGPASDVNAVFQGFPFKTQIWNLGVWFFDAVTRRSVGPSWPTAAAPPNLRGAQLLATKYANGPRSSRW